MFPIIALPFDAYPPCRAPGRRWLLTCLARYANRAGEAWPTMRALAKDAAMSLASVSRHLKAMAEEGVFQRERLPGGGRLSLHAGRALPAALASGTGACSTACKTVFRRLEHEMKHDQKSMKEARPGARDSRNQE